MSAGGIFNEFYRIMDHCQRAQPKEIHFQKPQFLQCRHGKLGNDGTVGASGQRNKFIRRLLADDYTRCMHGGMSGQSFQTLAHINQMMYLFVLLVQLTELRIHFQSLIQGNIQLVGNHITPLRMALSRLAMEKS